MAFQNKEENDFNNLTSLGKKKTCHDCRAIDFTKALEPIVNVPEGDFYGIQISSKPFKKATFLSTALCAGVGTLGCIKVYY
jgi:hypothetical protein